MTFKWPRNDLKPIINPNLFSDYLWKFESSWTRSNLMFKSRSIRFKMFIRMWYRLWINWCTGNLFILSPKSGLILSLAKVGVWYHVQKCDFSNCQIHEYNQSKNNFKNESRFLIGWRPPSYDWLRAPSNQKQFENQPYQFQNRLNSSWNCDAFRVIPKHSF